MNEELQFGIELECLTHLNRKELINLLKSKFSKYKIISKNTNELKIYKNNTIYIIYDMSIGTDDEVELILSKKNKIKKQNINKIYSYEIVFPICLYDDLIENINIINLLFKNYKLRMNHTCGIHVNVSFVDINITRKIDIGKLYFSFNHDKWLKYYNRIDNIYCKKQITKKQLNAAKKYSDNCKNISKFLERITKSIFNHQHKYKTINICNLYNTEKRSRIEFRICGGKRAMNISTFKKYIDDIIKAMKFSVGIIHNKSVITRNINNALKNI